MGGQGGGVRSVRPGSQSRESWAPALGTSLGRAGENLLSSPLAGDVFPSSSFAGECSSRSPILCAFIYKPRSLRKLILMCEFCATDAVSTGITKTILLSAPLI